jgi:hypothetical protein
MIKNIFYITGAMLFLLTLMAPAQDEVEPSLFPHMIVIDDETVVELKKLTRILEMEILELDMVLDPSGSFSVRSGGDRIDIRINSTGVIEISPSPPLSLSETIEKKIVGINKISLKSDNLNTGEIELILDPKIDLNKKDWLILPVIWKLGKRGVRSVVDAKKTVQIVGQQ